MTKNIADHKDKNSSDNYEPYRPYWALPKSVVFFWFNVF